MEAFFYEIPAVVQDCPAPVESSVGWRLASPDVPIIQQGYPTDCRLLTRGAGNVSGFLINFILTLNK